MHHRMCVPRVLRVPHRVGFLRITPMTSLRHCILVVLAWPGHATTISAQSFKTGSPYHSD